MTDKVEDIFGQIDALLGKRSAEVLADKPTHFDDFPMLTEVIEGHDELALQGAERRVSEQSLDGRRVHERRAVQRRHSANVESVQTGLSEENTHLVAVLETRLTQLFLLQQKKLEQSLLQMIRDEIGGKPGN